MTDEKLPIKFFAPREIDEQMVEGGGNQEPPKWLLDGEKLEQRASRLITELEGFEAAIAEKEETDSLVPFVCIAKMCDDATAKSRRQDISELFQGKSHNNVIGLSRSTDLLVRLDSLEEMRNVVTRLSEHEKSSYAISCLESFRNYEPFVITEEGSQNYKVKLLDFQDYELNVAIRRLFENAVGKQSIAFAKTDYSDRLAIYKLKSVNAATLDSITKSDLHEAILMIEPMPIYSLALDAIEDTHSVTIQQPDELRKYVTVGILDNGVAPIPHLAPWLVGDRWTVYEGPYRSDTRHVRRGHRCLW